MNCTFFVRGELSRSVTGAAIDANGNLVLEFSVGEPVTVGRVVGADGDDGVTPNFTIGTVTLVPAGTEPTVTITGTAENPVLNFGIPAGGSAGESTPVDAYTKNQIDTMLEGYPTRGEVDDAIAAISPGSSSEILHLDGVANGTYACHFTAGATYILTNSTPSVYSVSCATRLQRTQELGGDQISKNMKNGDSILFIPTVDADWLNVYVKNGGVCLTVTKEVEKYATEREINAIREDVGKLSGQIPDYWLDNLTAAETRIKNNMMAAGRNGDTFVFITDIHWEQNAKNSPSLIRHVLECLNINTIICGGDLIGQDTREIASSTMLECVKAFDFKNAVFLPVMGNHDTNWNDYNGQTNYAERHFTVDDTYALMGKQTENVAVHFGSSTMNYYVDKPTSRTRYIMLDTGEQRTSFEAYQELVDCLLSTPAGYHAVVVAHIVDSGVWGNNVQPILDACNARTTVTVNGTAYDLSGAECSVAIALGGHIHTDGYSLTTGGIPVVRTDTDARGTNTKIDDVPVYEKGTITEQCFDVVTLDYTHGTAKLVRIGRGVDREYDLYGGASDYVPQDVSVVEVMDNYYTKDDIDSLLSDSASPGKKSVKPVQAYKEGNDYQIRSQLGNYIIVHNLNRYNSKNKGMDFGAIHRCSNVDIDAQYKLTGTLWKSELDDIAPVHYNNSYRAGGHCINGARKITSSAHGLTEADIGSVLVSANNISYVLLSIIDDDHFLVVSDYTGNLLSPVNTANPTSPFVLPNTDSVSFTEAISTPVAPGTANISFAIYNDAGEELTEDGVLGGEHIDIVESYTVVNFPGMLETLKSNVGNNTNESYYADDLTMDALYQTTYRYLKTSACVVSSNFTPLKSQVKVSYLGGVQAVPCGNLVSVPFSIYKSLEFRDAAIVINQNALDDPEFPPYKMISRRSDIRSMGFEIGLCIDGTSAAPAVRIANCTNSQAWFGMVSKQNKMYPYFYSNGNGGSSSAEGYGKSFSVIAYRAPVLFENDIATVLYQVGSDWYAEIDIYSSYSGKIKLHPCVDAKRVEVIKKSDSVSIFGDVVSGGCIYASCDTIGSALLKIH